MTQINIYKIFTPQKYSFSGNSQNIVIQSFEPPIQNTRVPPWGQTQQAESNGSVDRTLDCGSNGCEFETHHSQGAVSESKVSKGAKIRSRYNQVPHPTQDTNGKVTNSQLDTTNESQEVSPFPAGDHKAHINRRAQRHSKHKTEQKHKRSIYLLA